MVRIGPQGVKTNHEKGNVPVPWISHHAARAALTFLAGAAARDHFAAAAERGDGAVNPRPSGTTCGLTTIEGFFWRRAVVESNQKTLPKS